MPPCAGELGTTKTVRTAPLTAILTPDDAPADPEVLAAVAGVASI